MNDTLKQKLTEILKDRMRLEEINEEFRDYLISIAGCDTNFNWLL